MAQKQPIQISNATAADAPQIAHLFSVSWTDPFAVLQFGAQDRDKLAAGMAPRLAEILAKPGKITHVIRDDDGKVLCCAQWTTPEGEKKGEEAKQEGDGDDEDLEPEYTDWEEKRYVESLPKNFNTPLIKDFRRIMVKLRKECMKGRVYTLENVATLPSHQRQGHASALIRHMFEIVDKDKDSMIYLDTEAGGDAARLYDHLGFEEAGRASIDDLTKYGGEGSYTLLGMVRYPKSQS